MKTASETIKQQHLTIAKAIELMQAELNALTDTISPDTKSWADVGKFAHVGDMANEIIARLEEK